MIKSIPIQQLVDSCVKYLFDNDYAFNTIVLYKRRWKNGIIPFMEENHLSLYSVDIGKSYLQFCVDNGKDSKRGTKAIHVLNDMLLYGTLTLHRSSDFSDISFSTFGNEIKDFLSHLSQIGRSEATIYAYRNGLRQFIEYLYSVNGIKKNVLRNITLLNSSVFIVNANKKTGLLLGIYFDTYMRKDL